MKDFALTSKEIVELRLAHKDAKQRRLADRIKAVLLLGTDWSYVAVCEVLLLDDDTLRSYVKRYQSEGLSGLTKNRYPGGKSKLTSHEIEALVAHLSAVTYCQVEEIIAYVKTKYGVAYTVSGMTDLLHREGFVYKKSKVIPGKCDAQAQKEFVEFYESLKSSKGENDPIYFSDGAHPTHNTQSYYGWIKRGETKEIRSNTGRRRININGAINIETKEVVAHFTESVNAQTTVELLKSIEQAHPSAETIYMINDNARYYRSKIVKTYLESSKIKMLFLPPYSPNLNLIERLWKYFRKKVTRGKFYETYEEFVGASRNFFDRIVDFKSDLDSLLTENFQIIGS